MVAGPAITAEADATEDELQRRFDKMTFVIATVKLAQLPHWMNVSADLVKMLVSPLVGGNGFWTILSSKGGPIRNFRCVEATSPE